MKRGVVGTVAVDLGDGRVEADLPPRAEFSLGNHVGRATRVAGRGRRRGERERRETFRLYARCRDIGCAR